MTRVRDDRVDLAGHRGLVDSGLHQLAAQHLRPGAQQREWCAQLVAGIGDEASLQRERRLERPYGADAQPDAEHRGEQEAEESGLREHSEQREALRLSGCLVQDDLDLGARIRPSAAGCGPGSRARRW